MKPLNQAAHYEPGTTLIALSPTDGYRRGPAPRTFSNRPSQFSAGDVVTAHTDTPRDRFLVTFEGDVYHVNRGDFALLPDPVQVAWLLVEHASQAKALESAKKANQRRQGRLDKAVKERDDRTAQLLTEQARTQAAEAQVTRLTAEVNDFRHQLIEVRKATHRLDQGLTALRDIGRDPRSRGEQDGDGAAGAR